MLKKHAQLFEGLFTASDLIVVSVAWVLSYWLRFVSGYLPVDKGIPPLADYLRMLIFVWPIWAYVFRRFNLYRPMRGQGRIREILNVVRANSFAIVLLLAVTYLFREKSVPFSRAVFVIFWFTSTTLLVSSRSLIRTLLRDMRSRGYNLRYVLIVGSGQLANKVASRILAHPEFGIQLLGCLSSDREGIVSSGVVNGDVSTYYATNGNGGSTQDVRPAVRQINGQPVATIGTGVPQGKRGRMKVIGTYADLPKLLEEGGIDQVIVALPLADHDRMETVMSSIGDSMVDVRIVPDYHQFIQLGSLVEDFDGLPVVSIASTPLSGINRFTKRSLDLLLGVVFFIIALPIMLVTALLVKLTSRGPVFFTQERVGLDGQSFTIYKFRTMCTDAECDGAKFAVKGDARVTPLGKFLRRFNIDELPQLVNVIKGHMSLVGPRPERPVFIQEFRRHFPRYMLRHKVQAGMTGWAQVNGWRGNTSIERRIQHDLYYIENWSLGLDLKIIGLTFLNSFRDKNAY